MIDILLSLERVITRRFCNECSCSSLLLFVATRLELAPHDVIRNTWYKRVRKENENKSNKSHVGYIKCSFAISLVFQFSVLVFWFWFPFRLISFGFVSFRLLSGHKTKVSYKFLGFSFIAASLFSVCLSLSYSSYYLSFVCFVPFWIHK